MHTCHLETMDGTKVDVAMSNTDNTARVIAAKTGEVLAEQSFELLGTLDCPLSLMASEWHSAEPKQHLQSMLAPLQPEGAPKSNLRPAIKNEACAGVPLLEAAPYDPNSSDEVFLTTSYRQDDSGFPTVSSMPTGLYEAMLHGSSADPQKVQLAVCVTGTPKAKSKDCRFDGGKTLELHDGDYEVVVREALTGKEVERKTFAAAGGECPTSALFRDGESTAVNLGAPEPALGEYIESLTRAEPAD